MGIPAKQTDDVIYVYYCTRNILWRNELSYWPNTQKSRIVKLSSTVSYQLPPSSIYVAM